MGVGVQQADRTEQIARAFVAARAAGTALTAYPGAPPERLAAAYAVQDAAIALADRPVAGWKVGRIDPPFDGSDRLAGPIFAERVSFDAAPAMPVFRDGFAAAEAEFLLRIGVAPDPARRRYSPAQAVALIDAAHVGIEIASSPFPGINQHGPAVTVSDFGNNNGLVVGAALPDWRDQDLTGWPVELYVNGARIGAEMGSAIPGGPFAAAAFLFEHMAARGVRLAAGQWISTGAITGVHPVAVGDTVEARFDGRLSVRCTITAQ